MGQSKNEVRWIGCHFQVILHQKSFIPDLDVNECAQQNLIMSQTPIQGGLIVLAKCFACPYFDQPGLLTIELSE